MDDAPNGGTDATVLSVFETRAGAGEPLTTGEVAAALDYPRRRAEGILDAAAGRDVLESRVVGHGVRVWWVPARHDRSGRERSSFGDVDPRSRDDDDQDHDRGQDHDHEFVARLCGASPVGTAVIDSTGTVVHANDRLAELLGRSRAEVTGRSILDRSRSDPDGPIVDEPGRRFVDGSDRPPDGEVVDGSDRPPDGEGSPTTRVLATGEPVFGVRRRITRPDGTDRWLSSNWAPVESDDGTVEWIVVGVEDVTEFVEAEAQLRSQRTELVRLDRVNSVVRGVARAVTRAATRTDIEREVCRLVARSEPYLFAVLGHFSSSYTEFTPRASAGIGEDYLAALLEDPDAPPLDEGPGARAARTGEVQVVQQITDLPYDYWQETAERHRFHSYASVPLVHEGVVHGVLGVYAREPAAFDDEERALLEELGGMVGYGLHAIEATERLRSEQVVELEFRSAALARPFLERDAADVAWTVDGTVPLADGTQLQYRTVTGVPSRTYCETVTGRPSVLDVRLLRTVAETFGVEVHSTGESLPAAFAAWEGRATSARLDGDGLVVLGEFPAAVDPDAVLAAARCVCADLELAARRLVYTPRLFREIAADRLTDRQWTTVQLAYYAGYFEQPRRSTGTELAERMGVTATTFHRHLRNAEERLFEGLFDASWSREPGP